MNPVLKSLTSLLLVVTTVSGQAQSVGINADGSSPDASAMLDVKSASKGFLPPRIALTGTGDVSTIVSPAAGLLVYNTATASDVSPGYYYFNGTVWVRLGTAGQANQWTTAGTSIYYNSGNVGIGTSAPSNHLHIWSPDTLTPTSVAILNNYRGLNKSAGDYELSSLKLGASWAYYLGFSTISAKIPYGHYGDAVRLDFSTPEGSNDNTQKVRMSILPFDGNVGIGTVSPSASAALEVSSTSKGFLPPHMTCAQRDQIATPSAGLMVFCTDCGTNGALSVFLPGSGWITYSPCIVQPPAAGQHLPEACSITWKWNAVPGAAGYKWNTENNYSSATNLNTSVSWVETGLSTTSSYTRYVWAYSACGTSTPTELVQSTSAMSVPAAGTHILAFNQITWAWHAVSGAVGYKWNTTDNYTSACDMGADTLKIETGLLANTTYSRYVWAVYLCGVSAPVTLTGITVGGAAPTAGIHIPGNDHITWKWNAMPGAIGYKWGTTNDFTSAEDMGTVTSRMETGLVEGQTYTRYAWAIYDSAPSGSTAMTVSTLYIGMSYQGGKIFIIDSTGEHGMIAAFTDMPARTWGCQGSSIPTSYVVGAGMTNTVSIQTMCNQEHAAREAYNYVNTFNGVVYDDWFLPSSNELNEMYVRRYQIGGFNSGTAYWSSTEYDNGRAWAVSFSDGMDLTNYKITNSFVRPARNF